MSNACYHNVLMYLGVNLVLYWLHDLKCDAMLNTFMLVSIFLEARHIPQVKLLPFLSIKYTKAPMSVFPAAVKS